MNFSVGIVYDIENNKSLLYASKFSTKDLNETRKYISELMQAKPRVKSRMTKFSNPWKTLAS